MMGWMSAPSPLSVCTPNQKAGAPPGEAGLPGTTMEAESLVMMSVGFGAL